MLNYFGKQFHGQPVLPVATLTFPLSFSVTSHQCVTCVEPHVLLSTLPSVGDEV